MRTDGRLHPLRGLRLGVVALDSFETTVQAELNSRLSSGSTSGRVGEDDASLPLIILYHKRIETTGHSPMLIKPATIRTCFLYVEIDEYFIQIKRTADIFKITLN